MKAFNFALMSALCFAQLEEQQESPWKITEGEAVEIQTIAPTPDQLSLDVSYQYFVGESEYIRVDALQVAMTVSGELQDQNNVVTYASFADPISVGRYQTFTCSTIFNSDPATTYATDVEVLNYYGRSKFSAGQSTSGKTSSQYNSSDITEKVIWKPDLDASSIP